MNQNIQTYTNSELKPYCCVLKDCNLDDCNLNQSEKSLSTRTSRSWFYGNEINNIYKIPIPTQNKVIVGVFSFGGGLFGNVDSNGILTNGDVQKYWRSLGISDQNMPRVIIKTLNGVSNNPMNDNATIENTIDIESIGVACPSSKLTIILYLINNSFNSFITLMNFVLNNKITINNEDLIPNIISISWGAPEIYFPNSLLEQINILFSQAAAKKINITCASGDYGSTNGTGSICTDFPSSSPNVIACGGTNLKCPNYIYDNNTIETAWVNGGGAPSNYFSKPSYQQKLAGNKRLVPDLSMNADPNTGVMYLINNQSQIVGGTSIVSPYMAGYLASIYYFDFLNNKIYNSVNCFNDIKSGNNGDFNAVVGYDNCTGLGTIKGDILKSFLNNELILIKSLNIIPSSTSCNIGDKIIFNTIINPSNASKMNLIWSSSNNLVATVNNGTVTGLSQGIATITCSTTDGSNLNVTSRINVNPIIIRSINILPNTISLTKNSTYQTFYNISPKNANTANLLWSSDNPNIATVSNTGLIRSINNGTTNIRVRSNNSNVRGLISVTVFDRINSIRLNISRINLNVNQTYDIIHIVNPTSLRNVVQWRSSNNNIATVSNGKVTAKSSGNAIITCSYGNVIARCEVVVIAKMTQNIKMAIINSTKRF